MVTMTVGSGVNGSGVKGKVGQGYWVKTGSLDLAGAGPRAWKVGVGIDEPASDMLTKVTTVEM